MEILATYERIVLSDLRPNLSKYETEEGLDQLERSIYSFKLNRDTDSETVIGDLFDVLPSIKPGDSFDFDVDKDNHKISITIQPNPDEEELINIDLEPPMDKKGEIFYQIIEDEFIRIKRKLTTLLAESSNHEDLQFTVLKFIAKAKQLGREAHTFEKKLRASNTETGRSSRYVIKILTKYLVYSILEAQEIFAPILKLDMQTEDDLEDELYEHSKTKIKLGAKDLGQKLEKKRLERVLNSIEIGEFSQLEISTQEGKDQEATKKTSLEIISKFNFEKASKIICEGIADRMPGLLNKIKDLKELSENDKKQFQKFEGLTKDEIYNKIKDKIHARRDSLVSSYHKVFIKIDEKSVDPEYTKDQVKRIVYENIVQNETHFTTLRQYPYDWNNDELFGTLWGHTLLIGEWNKNLSKSNKAEFDELFLTKDTEVAIQEFRKLHDEITEACSPSQYPSDSVTHSLFAKAVMLVNKFYEAIPSSKAHFKNELNSVKSKTNGFNNSHKLYGLEKFVANVVLEDLRINEKFKPSPIAESSSNSTKDVANSVTRQSWSDRQIFRIKNNKGLGMLFLMIGGLIWLATATDALVKLGFLKDKTTDLQGQEFFTNNPPQFDLWYSAFYPDNRDPLLKETLLDDTIGITGSYRLINKGRAIITLEEINLPNVFGIRGYFTDRIVELPYPLSPGDTIVISCKLLGKELPIIETENALKKDISLKCSYPVADIRFTYKFQWREGLFRKSRVTIE